MLAHCPSSRNGYLMATPGKLKVARKGTSHPTSLCRWLRISVLSNRHSPNVWNHIWDYPLLSSSFHIRNAVNVFSKDTLPRPKVSSFLDFLLPHCNVVNLSCRWDLSGPRKIF